MSNVKFTFKGVDVEVENAADAVLILRQLTQDTGAKVAVVESKRPAQEELRRRVNGDVNMLVDFLQGLHAAPGGLVHTDLMKIVGAETPKGLGGRLARINFQIGKLGFDVAKVYRKSRTPEGRVWKPGNRIVDAIAAARMANVKTEDL